MANLFVDNKDRWLSFVQKPDIEPAMLFIRAWIPFNAWYCNSYPQLNNKDFLILKEIKTSDNIIKNRIISLLNGNDVNSADFKSSIGQLHLLLERHYIPTEREKRITFTELWYRENPDTNKSISYNRHELKAEYTNTNNTKSFSILVVRSSNGSFKLNYRNSSFNIDHLKADSNFKILPPLLQEKALECFNGINPKKKENLIATGSRYINCGEIRLINDSDLVAQAIIEILYRLRCVLFHGEINPTQEALGIYDYGYKILNLLLPTLR